MLDAIKKLSATQDKGGFSYHQVEGQVEEAIFQGNKHFFDLADREALKGHILNYWTDLLRNNTISFGSRQDWELDNFHVTETGRETLRHADRDPMNPPGYLAYLDQEAAVDTVSRGYIEEALKTYIACCYKATAVMVGAAVETIVLDLRDTLLPKLKEMGKPIPAGLDTWQVKTVLEALAGQVLPDLKSDAKKSANGEALRKLYEDATSRLLPAAADFRRLRNDAGHPAALGPIEPADVHCNLLLFPSTAKLLKRLKDWVVSYYV